jgi:hypothetical protein
MPIMAAHDQNDARGSARWLASTARRGLEEPPYASSHVSALNNLFRLLEAYRAHRFAGFDFEPRSARGPEALTLLPAVERHIVDLRVALDRAFDEVYQGQDRDQAVTSVEDVLRAAAYPESGASQDRERRRVSSFLEKFIDHLYAVR